MGGQRKRHGAPSDDPASETSPSPSPVVANPLLSFLHEEEVLQDMAEALEDKVKALEEKSTKNDAKIAEQANTIASNEAKIAALEKQVRENSQKAKWFDECMEAKEREEQEERKAKRARAE